MSHEDGPHVCERLCNLSFDWSPVLGVQISNGQQLVAKNHFGTGKRSEGGARYSLRVQITEGGKRSGESVFSLSWTSARAHAVHSAALKRTCQKLPLTSVI
jgi:hypothetical protein